MQRTFYKQQEQPRKSFGQLYVAAEAPKHSPLLKMKVLQYEPNKSASVQRFQIDIKKQEKLGKVKSLRELWRSEMAPYKQVLGIPTEKVVVEKKEEIPVEEISEEDKIIFPKTIK